MRHFVLLSSLLFFVFLNASGQKGLEDLKKQLLSADSVIIVSHEETAGIALVDEKTGKYLPLPRLILSGKLNEKIIHEKRVLRDTSIQRLSAIMTRPFQDDEIEMGKCFLPHHAVVFYKKSKASFIDICFGCRGIETSKDIKISAWDFDDKKWNELQAFFIQHDMTYELGLEGVSDDE